MDQFHIRPLTEADLSEIVEAAGGRIAHPDAPTRLLRGADYVLDDAVIELKALDEDGLQKAERQRKLAALFRRDGSGPSVVVLDRANLSDEKQRAFDQLIAAPLKGPIASARVQLKQSRSEILDSKLSILWIVNNGYTALDHDELLRLVSHRVRSDTTSIDGVIVGGCYFHSDGMEHLFTWPLTYVPIRLETFAGFEALHAAWDGFAEKFMTQAMRGELGTRLLKGPVIDSHFVVDGVTFVKPAPPLGMESDFYPRGRPRLDSTGLTSCPPVAMTFPSLSRANWTAFRTALPHELFLEDSYEAWLGKMQSARADAEPIRPLVPIEVAHDDWCAWCKASGWEEELDALFAYVAERFNERIQAVLRSAREMKPESILPSRYALAVTDEIGQDRANDLSHIALVRQPPQGERLLSPIVEDVRIFHEHAVALTAAYAVAEGLEAVMWIRHTRYAWK